MLFKGEIILKNKVLESTFGIIFESTEKKFYQQKNSSRIFQFLK